MKFSFVIFLILANVNLGVVLGYESSECSAVGLIHDIYNECLRKFSVNCVKPKALQWITDVSAKDEIKITEDLVIVRKDNPEQVEVRIVSLFCKN